MEDKAREERNKEAEKELKQTLAYDLNGLLNVSYAEELYGRMGLLNEFQNSSKTAVANLIYIIYNKDGSDGLRQFYSVLTTMGQIESLKLIRESIAAPLFGLPHPNNSSPANQTNTIATQTNASSKAQTMTSNAATLRYINVICFVPHTEDMNEFLKKIFCAMDFKCEAQSSYLSLWSSKSAVHWHVLVIQYKGSSKRLFRDCLYYANEAVLGVFDNLLGKNLVALSHYTNSNGENIPLSSSGFKSTAFNCEHFDEDAASLVYQMFETILAERCCPKRKEENYPLRFGAFKASSALHEECWQQYLESWLATRSNTSSHDLFICFSFDTKIHTFTEDAKKAIEIVKKSRVTKTHQLVRSSILVYATCPAYGPWYLTLNKEELFNEALNQGLRLRSIYEASVEDVEQSMARPDNAEFKDKLEQLKQQMLAHPVKHSHRFEITFPLLPSAILHTIGLYLVTAKNEVHFAMTCHSFYDEYKAKKVMYKQLRQDQAQLKKYITRREREQDQPFSYNVKLQMIQVVQIRNLNWQSIVLKMIEFHGSLIEDRLMTVTFLPNDEDTSDLLDFVWNDDSDKVKDHIESKFKSNTLELFSKPIIKAKQKRLINNIMLATELKRSILHYIIRQQANKTWAMIVKLVEPTILVRALQEPINDSLLHLASEMHNEKVFYQLLALLQNNKEAAKGLISHRIFNEAHQLKILQLAIQLELQIPEDISIAELVWNLLYEGNIKALELVFKYKNLTSPQQMSEFLLVLDNYYTSKTLIFNVLKAARTFNFPAWPILRKIVEVTNRDMLHDDIFLSLITKYNNTQDESHLEEDFKDALKQSDHLFATERFMNKFIFAPTFSSELQSAIDKSLQQYGYIQLHHCQENTVWTSQKEQHKYVILTLDLTATICASDALFLLPNQEETKEIDKSAWVKKYQIHNFDEGITFDQLAQKHYYTLKRISRTAKLNLIINKLLSANQTTNEHFSCCPAFRADRLNLLAKAKGVALFSNNNQ